MSDTIDTIIDDIERRGFTCETDLPGSIFVDNVLENECVRVIAELVRRRWQARTATCPDWASASPGNWKWRGRSATEVDGTDGEYLCRYTKTHGIFLVVLELGQGKYLDARHDDEVAVRAWVEGESAAHRLARDAEKR